MKRPVALALLVLPLMAGCASASSAERRHSEAYAHCKYSPGPKERETCIKTELALIEARERKEAQEADAEHEAAEQRQAIREASGMTAEDARESVQNGLRPPN